MKKALFFPLQVSLCTVGYICATSSIAQAQVTTDGTVNTQVTQDGNVSEITGGETRGGNLFHSFQDFSVQTGNEAFFNNANDISNIFSRVTGGNISNIDGLIRANDSASLFLINPAGIVFGENARLDIGGSFYGSSASSILFEGGEFSAADLDNPPLLTINAPIGLGFRDEPGDITVRGNGQGTRLSSDLIDTNDGLRVDSDRTFALAGGNLIFEGATIKTAGGRIELGSVEGNEQISLAPVNEDFSLDFEGVQNFRNIQLSQVATIDASGIRSGAINFVGNNITFDEQTTVVANTFGDLNGEKISVLANEQLSLSNESLISLSTTGIGSSGSLEIETKNLSINNGSSILNTTFSRGDGGDISIKSNETVNLTGTGLNNLQVDVLQNIVSENFDFSDFQQLTGISSTSFGIGNSGEIIINTPSLILQDDALLSNTTFEQGLGNNISLLNSQSILIDDSIIVSGVTSSNSTGSAGNINIDTENLSIFEGGGIISNTIGLGKGGDIKISASSSVKVLGNSLEFITPSVISSSSLFNTGEAGLIQIDTGRLILEDGGSITTGSGGRITEFIQINRGGSGGDLLINATESVEISGIFPSTKLPSSLTTSTFSTSSAGNLTVNTNNLIIRDNAEINVSSNLGAGLGETGNLEIKANSLSIANRSSILAETSFGDGGNLNLQIQEQIVLEDNSRISAQATGNANGGNVDIDTQFIISFPNGNNDILASAEQGQGGNISINAESLLGIQERTLNDFTNDINASSQVSGLDGTISISTPDINPVQGATELPTNIVEPEETSQQACRANRETGAKNGLNVTGKGGVVPDPASPLSSLNVASNDDTNSTSSIPAPIETSQGKIQPARGIEVTEDGGIRLVAYRTNNAGDRIPKVKRNCGQV